MFQSLSDRLSGILDKLTRRGSLTDSDVAEAMREVRRALLEADVALEVVRDFTDKVKAKADRPGGDQVDHAGPDGGQDRARRARAPCWARTPSPSTLPRQPPVTIMLVGLQGSGKTTTCAKIGYRLTNRDKKKVLMASLDTRRPAAQEQLRVLGEQTKVDTLADRRGPDAAADRAARLGCRAARRLRRGAARHRRPHPHRRSADAGDRPRCATSRIRTRPCSSPTASPARTPSKLAKSFDERVGITGIVLTRVDGDGRGGAALSMRAVTGKPIKLIGVGEKWDALEDFHPAAHRRPHPRHGRRGQPGREGRADDRHREGAEHRREDAQGRLRPGGPGRSAQADGEARRHVEHAGACCPASARSRGKSTTPISTTASSSASAPSSRR